MDDLQERRRLLALLNERVLHIMVNIKLLSDLIQRVKKIIYFLSVFIVVAMTTGVVLLGWLVYLGGRP
jgi:hypothetical protein